MILGGKTIIDEQANGNIIIEPFDISMVGPNSVDVHLAPVLRKLLPNWNGVIDPMQKQKYEEHDLNREFCIVRPGELWLASTIEEVGSTKYVPMIEGRSSIGRMGLRIHQTAGFGDCGFCLTWVLEIDCVMPVILSPGMRIAQVFFHTITDASMQYNGRYKNQSGPVESKYSE